MSGFNRAYVRKGGEEMKQGNPQNNHALIFAACVAVTIVLIVVAVLANQSQKRPVMESVPTTILCPVPLHEVGLNVCDDDVDTAYLVIRNEHYVPDEQILQQIVTSKKTWEAKFPSRHIVSMIQVGGNAIHTGILIHYNNESK